MKENLRKEKGITLIALVVTIIVLIILAGVSINLVLGDNGIIAKARQARTETEQAKQNEQIAMNELMEDWDDLVGGTTEKTEMSDAEKYYGDASIVPSPAEIFIFTVDDATQTASVAIPSFNNEGRSEIINDITYYHLKYNGEEVKELIIPYECEKDGKKYLVTSIADLGFRAASSYLEKLIIPNSIISIGDMAFEYTVIPELIIPNSVTSIGNSAFGYCKDLAEVKFEMTTAPTFGHSCFNQYSGHNPVMTTFYFKNKTVSDALIAGTHYSETYGTKSEDYSW